MKFNFNLNFGLYEKFLEISTKYEKYILLIIIETTE